MGNEVKKVSQKFNLVNAKYKLTTFEIKFILNAISKLDSKNQTVLEEYIIPVSELETKIGIGEGRHTRLKQFAKGLMSKPIVIENGKDFEVYNWFSRIKYVNGEARFIVRFEEGLKPYLLELKGRFVSYGLQYILPLTSTYSIRIYQLLKEYEKLKIRYFLLEELQNILQVPKSYKIYADFKRKVLQVAERELLEHTDIYFNIEEEKEGRKVSRLIFRIYHNSHKKEAEAARVLDASKPIDYTNLYGMNCKIKSKICEHLLMVTGLADGSINCSFRSGENYHFKSVNDLLELKY